MAAKTFTPLKGNCTCKLITYEVLAPFLAVNCCHCTWCQRETGTAFATNGVIESSNLCITSDTKPVLINIPSASGNGQMVARCPNCQIALYSDYGGDGTWMAFVSTGTLDDESKTVKPDAHIFTTTKMDWLDLTSEKERGVPVMEGYYQRSQVWRKDALERFDLLKEKIEAAKKEESRRRTDKEKNKVKM